MPLQSIIRTYHSIALLRAVAAFWVLFAHCMIWGGWYGVPLPSAKIAVDLFMLLSGFLMVATADARDDREPLARYSSWRRFWLRRVFRIAPLYYLALFLAIVLRDPFTAGYAQLQALDPAHWVGAPAYDPALIHFSLTNILLHVTFLYGLVPAYVDASYLPDWSLSLEMQFYAVFPALLLIMRRFGFARAALAIGLASIALGQLIAARIAYPEPSLLPFKLPYFLAGMLACHALGRPRWPALRGMACALALVSWEVGYGRELLLRSGLMQLRDRYDYVIIDTPPSLGLLTGNALTAADTVIVPLQAHAFALKALPQLEQVIGIVHALNPSLAIGGIVVTMSDRRTTINRMIEETVRAQYGDLVFKTVIPFNVRLVEAPAVGAPISTYAPGSSGAQAYRDLALEVAHRWPILEARHAT